MILVSRNIKNYYALFRVFIVSRTNRLYMKLARLFAFIVGFIYRVCLVIIR